MRSRISGGSFTLFGDGAEGCVLVLESLLGTILVLESLLRNILALINARSRFLASKISIRFMLRLPYMFGDFKLAGSVESWNRVKSGTCRETFTNNPDEQWLRDFSESCAAVSTIS